MHILVPSLIAIFDIALPWVLLLWLWKSRALSRGYFFSIAAVVATYLVAISVSVLGYWHAIGIFWPYIYLFAFVTIVVVRYRRGMPSQWLPDRWTKQFYLTGVNVVHAGIWALLIFQAFIARSVNEKALQLSAPLHDGLFMVINGGGNLAVNAHTRSTQYALDITQLNWFGVRARSVVPFPKDVTAYTLYGAEVIAPCAGEVIGVENGVPNQAPLHPSDSGFGNYVALFCQGHTVRLVHLQPGSVKVAVGSQVTAGQVLANVGNSGNTIEPHLHIDAVTGRRIIDAHHDNGIDSVPIEIDHRFLVKGDMFTN